jgi:hypothetical protein
MATRKLSTHETSKPPRCQASERLELPIKGEGDKVKWRGKSEAKRIGKSIHLFKNNKHRVGQWQSKMSRIVRHGLEHDTSGSLPPPAGYYTRSANLGKKRKW